MYGRTFFLSNRLIRKTSDIKFAKSQSVLTEITFCPTNIFLWPRILVSPFCQNIFFFYVRFSYAYEYVPSLLESIQVLLINSDHLE